MISGDYHIHSRYSGFGHAKNTIEELWFAAVEKGLSEIGITDHGLKHIIFGTSVEKLSRARAEIDLLNRRDGPAVLLGLESNLLTEEGDLDCGDLNNLDYIAMGYHKMIGATCFKQAGRFVLPALFSSRSKKQRFTKAYVKAIEKYPLSFVTHLKRDMPVDAIEVAKAMSDYGVLLELNGKRVDLTDEELNEIVAKTKIRFILNSDAHKASNVGNVSTPLSTVERLGIPVDRIANLDKPASLKRLR